MYYPDSWVPPIWMCIFPFLYTGEEVHTVLHSRGGVIWAWFACVSRFLFPHPFTETRLLSSRWSRTLSLIPQAASASSLLSRIEYRIAFVISRLFMFTVNRGRGSGSQRAWYWLELPEIEVKRTQWGWCDPRTTFCFCTWLDLVTFVAYAHTPRISALVLECFLFSFLDCHWKYNFTWNNWRFAHDFVPLFVLLFLQRHKMTSNSHFWNFFVLCRTGQYLLFRIPVFCIMALQVICLICTQGRIQDFLLGGTNPHWRGCQPPTQALFDENICENERIWSCWGGGSAPETFVCRSATGTYFTHGVMLGIGQVFMSI